MSRLLIVSNRLPLTVVKKGKKLSFRESVGGLATGLSTLSEGSYTITWIGWPGLALDKLTSEEITEVHSHLHKYDYFPVFLTQSLIDTFYSGFCNKTIWPLFHYFTQHAVYDKSLWNAYVRANEHYLESVAKVYEPGDIIWVHDYHLLLLPQMLREKFPESTIGFFLHIPFPSFEVFRLLPWRREILEGLLGADLVGFHTFDYARHFFSSVRTRLGYEQSLGQIFIGNRIVKADAFPMGIHYERYADASKNPQVKKEIKEYRKSIGDKTNQKLILSVDRLDYTKGILERLYSYDRFLDKYPQYREKVKLILVAVPTRTKVEHYRQLKKDLDELVGRINGKHGTIDWMPVWYLYNNLPFPTLTSLYILSDVALVTPLRDGMNLIAKEYVATKTDGKGVLILSEMAGASMEMREALIVNPNNMERIADSLHLALTMPEEEQIERNRIMQKRLQRYCIEKWIDDFLKSLQAIKAYENKMQVKKLTRDIRKKIIKQYTESRCRLILLDYDGTLTPFKENPQDAYPDEEILSLLQKLAGDPSNDVLIISGRDRDTLGKWFGSLDIDMVAEHGVWLKNKTGDWALIEPLMNFWKDEIRPILEVHVDRTPGSFIEEKEYSLVWHFRKSDVELASVRARELKESVLPYTVNLGLGVMEGNKTVEIKDAGINKGHAALRWLTRKDYDFILAAGDDRTDEDIFQTLPEEAWSIKIGLTHSKAKYYLKSIYEFRAFLTDMMEGDVMINK